jgi:ABC-2 type transport system permease protein
MAKASKYIRQILMIACRECGILRKNHIYLFCMVVFPLFVIALFTSMLAEGQPADMPVGVVDQDNTSATRTIIRKLDAFQTSRVAAFYPDVKEARDAMQKNEIYAFLYIPKGTTERLVSGRQPTVSYYYSMTSLTSGALLYRDLKTITTLWSAAAGQAAMRARGYTDKQIATFLQPIAVDLHQISNPMTDYNVYLSTMLIPGVLMMFIFLITAYSIGTELKFKRSKEWMRLADNNIYIAIAGKLLPQTLIFLIITYAYEFYVFHTLNFPHSGGTLPLLVLGLLMVLASQGFGVFMFGLMPSLRMSMSFCSLWAVLSFSMAGSAFPVFSMDPMIEGMAYLFPLRYYFMTYQITVFNGYPFIEAWLWMMGLVAYAASALIFLPKIKNAMLTYVYIP